MVSTTLAFSECTQASCVRFSAPRGPRSQPKDIIGMIFNSTRNLTKQSQKEFLECAGSVISDKEFISGLPRTYQKCHQMSFQKSGPVVVLASTAGSGNSWVRQLLESATGIYTGAMYCDKAYVYAGMIGEGLKTQNVLAIKSHEKSAMVMRDLKPDKVIYIVRNPFESLLADWCRRAHKENLEQHTVKCVQTKGS